VYLDEGCIVAARHIHMPPDFAGQNGFADGEAVSVEAGYNRGMVLENVRVRVDSSFTLEMHLDTDEANGCGLRTGDLVRIVTGGHK
jgi:putative phosphotransacetylase